MFLYTMGMMKNKTKFKDNYYVRVTNIKWNEGNPYKGQKEFWFMITPEQRKNHGDDIVHNMALFQEIENQLDNAGDYGGIASDALQSEIYDYPYIKSNYPRFSIEAVDLT